jgi:hypothetical protein
VIAVLLAARSDYRPPPELAGLLDVYAAANYLQQLVDAYGHRTAATPLADAA